jgi:hypothetical protein
MNITWLNALIAAVVLFCTDLYAVEIYNFTDNSSQQYSGFVLGIDETHCTLLTLEGRLAILKKEDIAALYVYNIVQNPIEVLKLDAQMAEYARDVYTTNNETPSFSGFPIQMIDEMVIFFDLTGKIHVLGLYDIVKIRKYEIKSKGDITLLNYKKILLNIDTRDTLQNNSELTVYPTKVYKGKINISKFFTKTQDNFVKIYGYQERTHLYAKPMIFDQDFKIGNNFLFRKLGFKEYNIKNPYVQWSTGRAYGFQSKTTIGYSSSEWIPELSPMPILQSEVKTHFFNTLFVGNMNLGVLPAGTRIYTADGDNFSYVNSFMYNPHVEINFNYILMIGGDYGPYSASLGTFYLVHAININNHIREITAPESSPGCRFIYQKGDIKIKTVFSYTHYGSNNGNSAGNAYARYGSEMQFVSSTADGSLFRDEFGYSEYANDSRSPIKKYNLSSLYMRAGLIYNITSDLTVGVDCIVVAGKYSEEFHSDDIIAGNNTSYQLYKNRVTFRQYGSGISFHNRFSDYVALKAVFNYFYNTYDYNFFNTAKNEKTLRYIYGGAFELIF